MVGPTSSTMTSQLTAWKTWEGSAFQVQDESSCTADFIWNVTGIISIAKLAEGVLVGGYILIIIFSLCGNIAALVILLKSRAPKRSTKYFLICLVFSDLLMTATAPPVNISTIMKEYNAWIFGALMCKLVPSLQIVAAVMSAMCLMAIAVERNLMIVQTMRAGASGLHEFWRKWMCPVISAAIVVVPVAAGIPNLWWYRQVSFIPITTTTTTESPAEGTTEEPSSTSPRPSTPPPADCRLYYSCTRTFDQRMSLHSGITGGTYFLLLACFLACYISIYRFVKGHGEYWKRFRARQCSISSGTGHSIHNTSSCPEDSKMMIAERHRKTMKLILGLILLHLVCRFPNWLYIVITNTACVQNTVEIATLRECLHFLSAINSALNPFIYVIWNHSLRGAADVPRGAGRSPSMGRSCMWRSKKSCLQRLHHMFYSIGSCCKYKRESIVDGHGQFQESNPPTYVWLKKTPKVYHISGASLTATNQNNNNYINQSHSTQPMYISNDRSYL